MCFLPLLRHLLLGVEREKSSRTPHVPAYPSWYITLPTLLLAAGTALVAIGIYGFVASRWEICSHTFALGLVTIVFKIYHVVAEVHPKVYNYYAVVVPDGIISLWWTVEWLFWAHYLDVRENISHKSQFDVYKVLLAFCVLGSVVAIVSNVILGMAVSRHRNKGRECRSHRRGSGTPENDIEEGGSGTTSDNLDLEQTDGSRNTSENITGATNGNCRTSKSANMDTMDGNRDTSEAKASRRRTSVHYVPGHPYHPLRLNPITSTDMIRSVAPELSHNEKEIIDIAEKVPSGPETPESPVLPQLAPASLTIST